MNNKSRQTFYDRGTPEYRKRVRELSLKIPCGCCGAKKGETCRGCGGRPAKPHSERQDEARNLFMISVEDLIKEMKPNLGSNLKLRCPSCGGEQPTTTVPREPSQTDLILAQCPKCFKGETYTATYFQSDGRMLASMVLNEYGYPDKMPPH